MSTKYKSSKDVPTDALISRLKELSDAITGGRDSLHREFTMRIPAECDRDADLVIGEAASRLTRLQSEVERLRGRVAELESTLNDASIQVGRLDKAYILRKQAEAVEAVRDSIKEQYPLEPFGDLDEYVIAGMKEVYTYVEKSAQRLHQQADEAEQAVGEWCIHQNNPFSQRLRHQSNETELKESVK